MNEITRIHLARVAYDIELSAKKDFDNYLKAIKAALNDDDTLMEVEQRMSEILLEQGVKPGSVITATDITAIRTQLGEPQEFGDADNEEAAAEQIVQRQLFRDMERKQVAGVSAGLAAYFNIDVVIVRILFIILTLVNGLGLLIYLVLWAVTPPARTLSERMSLRGQAATLGAYKEYQPSVISTAPSWVKTLAQWVLGVAVLVVGWLPTVFGSVTTYYAFTHRSETMFPVGMIDWTLFVALWVGALAFSVFMTTLGFALLRWNFSRVKWPLIVSAVAALLAGLVVVATGMSGIQQYDERYQERACHIMEGYEFQQNNCGRFMADPVETVL